MSRTSIIVPAAVVLLLGGMAVYRGLQVIYYPVGEGRYEESPDGRFEADATLMHDESFWGRRTTWYEFEVIEKNSGRVVASHTMDVPPGARAVSWYGGEGTITWTSDSRTVTFSDGATSLWHATLR